MSLGDFPRKNIHQQRLPQRKHTHTHTHLHARTQIRVKAIKVNGGNKHTHTQKQIRAQTQILSTPTKREENNMKIKEALSILVVFAAKGANSGCELHPLATNRPFS